MQDQLSARLGKHADPWAGASIAELLGAIADPRDVNAWSVPGLRAARELAGPNVRGAAGNGIALPLTLLTRDLTASGASSAIGSPRIGYATSPRGLSALEALGLQVIPAPPGSVGVPVVTGTSTSGWLATEGAAVPESDITFGLRTGEPKTVGHQMNVSRALLKMGGPAAEALIRRQMLQDVGRALDAGILNGSGASGQPTGILAAAGAVSVSGTSLSDATLLDAERQVIAAGARWNELAYVAGATTYETLSGRERFTGAGSIIADGRLHGLPLLVSADMPADSLALGPWGTVMLMTYRGVSVFADPFTSGISGTVKFVVMVDCDVVIPSPGVFAVATSIT